MTMDSLLTRNGPNCVVKEEIEVADTVLQEQRWEAVSKEGTGDENITSGSARTSEAKPDLTLHEEVKGMKVAVECSKCSMRFGNRKLARSNMRKVHKDILWRPETCPICLRKFKYKSVLVVHMSNHHAKICPICNVVVSDSKALKNHIESLHIGQLDLVCPICFKLSIDSASHDAHVSSHNGRQSYECVDCCKYYASLEGLERHCRTHAGILKNKLGTQYKCSICLKVHASGQSLRVHMITHTDTHPYKCDQRPNRFPSPENLKRHRQSHSKTEKSYEYKCHVCSKVFTGQPSLNLHMNSHNAASFKCTQCDKAYAWPGGLVQHYRDNPSHGGYERKCSVCSMGFLSKHNLDRHMTTHIQAATYKCDVCPREFHSTKVLLQHRRFHLTYKCLVCDETFTSQQRLVVHMNAHPGMRPYKCDQCLKAYASPIAFKMHRKSKEHLMKPDKRKVDRLDKSSHEKSKIGETNKIVDLHTTLATNSPNDASFKCNQCVKTFAMPAGLVQHYRDNPSHSTGRQAEATFYKCDECPRQYYSLEFLVRHRRIHVTHKCLVCQETFSTQKCLVIHMDTHPGMRPYKCDQCPKAYASPIAFNLHRKSKKHLMKPDERKVNRSEESSDDKSKDGEVDKILDLHIALATNSHNDASFKCYQCEKAYAWSGGLVQHYRDNPSHGGYEHKKSNSEAPVYKCDGCPREFYSNDVLLRHRRIHLAHKCLVCYETFTTQQCLVAHLNTHPGMRPYKCDLCPKAYASPVSLKSHRKTHSMKPGECEVDRSDKSSRDRSKDGEVNKLVDVHTDLAKHKCKEYDKEFFLPPSFHNETLVFMEDSM